MPIDIPLQDQLQVLYELQEETRSRIAVCCPSSIGDRLLAAKLDRRQDTLMSLRARLWRELRGEPLTEE
jgi:hypothetical protein